MAALGSLLVIAAAIWIVRFVIYNIFVADVIEPLWTGSGDLRREIWGPNLFLISTSPLDEPIPPTGCCVVDLKEAPASARRWFAEQTTRIQRAPANQSVLVLHFDERLESPAFTRFKLHLLDRTIKVLNRTVVVVSNVPPSTAFEKEIESTPRWAELMSLFTIVPVKSVVPSHAAPGPGPLVADWATAGWREVLWRLNALGFAHAARFLDSEREDPQVSRLWKQVLPYAWHPEATPLEMDSSWWRLASAPRATIGRFGVMHTGRAAGARARRRGGARQPEDELTIRRLMARGLVRRQPNFTLMNETFRRFVLAMSPSVELAALEVFRRRVGRGARPFVVVFVACLVFLF